MKLRRRRFLRNSLVVSASALGLGQSPFMLVGLGQVRLGPSRVGQSGGTIASGGGGSCPADGSANQATSGSTIVSYVSQNTNAIYGGELNWNDGGTPVHVCKLGFQLTKGGGDISGKTLTAYIFALTGNNFTAVGSPLATSNGVTGNNSWSSTMVRFTFPSPFLTTASTNYALCFSLGALDASNYTTTYKTSGSTIPGNAAGWDSSGNVQINATGTNQVMEVYWF